MSSKQRPDVQNCAKGCAGCTTSLFPSIQMIRSYQLGKFLKFNLAGQTALQVDGAWASQTQIIQGFCKFAPPHMIVRADSLEEDLKLLTQQVGLSWQNPPPASRPQSPALSEIYDTELEALAREAYAADYSNFGFKPLDF